MSIKELIRKEVRRAIENFDWSDAFADALDDYDIEEIVQDKLKEKIYNYDFSSVIEETVETIIDEEMNDIDLDEQFEEEI